MFGPGQPGPEPFSGRLRDRRIEAGLEHEGGNPAEAVADRGFGRGGLEPAGGFEGLDEARELEIVDAGPSPVESQVLVVERGSGDDPGWRGAARDQDDGVEGAVIRDPVGDQGGGQGAAAGPDSRPWGPGEVGPPPRDARSIDRDRPATPPTRCRPLGQAFVPLEPGRCPTRGPSGLRSVRPVRPRAARRSPPSSLAGAVRRPATVPAGSAGRGFPAGPPARGAVRREVARATRRPRVVGGPPGRRSDRRPRVRGSRSRRPCRRSTTGRSSGTSTWGARSRVARSRRPAHRRRDEAKWASGSDRGPRIPAVGRTPAGWARGLSSAVRRGGRRIREPDRAVVDRASESHNRRAGSSPAMARIQARFRTRPGSTFIARPSWGDCR